MTQDQYYLLVQFPKNKTYLTDKQLERNLDKLGKQGDFDYVIEKYNELFYLNYVEGNIATIGLRITQKGLDALEDYRKERKANEKGFWKRLYEDKPMNFWIAVISGVVTLIGTIIAIVALTK
jgi:hypothetical protein